jgi:hypothetical protein
MKITKLFLIAITVVLFSCGGDDDPKPSSATLVGKWAVTGVDYKGTSTTSVDGIELESSFTGKGKDMNMTVTLNENPATFTSTGSYTVALTTTVMGASYTQDYPFEGFMIDGTWKQDGNTLTVTNSGGTQQATIVELTASSLKMTWDYTYTMTQDGATVKMNIQGAYTFKRK